MLLVVVIGNGLCIAAGQPKASGHHQTGNQAQDQNFHVILLFICIIVILNLLIVLYHVRTTKTMYVVIKIFKNFIYYVYYNIHY